VTARPPTHDEREVIDAVLAHDFEGADALRHQWAHALVEPSCKCGCGSIGFVFDGTVPQERRSVAPSPLPTDGDVLGEDGELIGGLLVLVRDGVLYDVDVYSFTDGPILFPPLARVRWRA
jgi:hypothetical protein